MNERAYSGTKYKGRPTEDNRTININIRCTAYQREKLDLYAEKLNMSISDIVREALAIWFNLNVESLKRSK